MKNRRINKRFLRNWAAKQEEESKRRQTRPFEAEELKEAIKLSKKGQEPGPDQIRMELIKWLDKNNRMVTQHVFNGWWKSGVAPDELYHARVASIYKKGDTSKAENYRPISLLSSLYKIYMILSRTRTQEEVEKTISGTQYGFRPAKNTAHAIFIIRRIQDFVEKPVRLGKGV